MTRGNGRTPEPSPPAEQQGRQVGRLLARLVLIYLLALGTYLLFTDDWKRATVPFGVLAAGGIWAAVHGGSD